MSPKYVKSLIVVCAVENLKCAVTYCTLLWGECTMVKLYPTDFSISLHRVSIAVTGDRHRYVTFFLAVKFSAKIIVC